MLKLSLLSHFYYNAADRSFSLIRLTDRQIICIHQSSSLALTIRLYPLNGVNETEHSFKTLIIWNNKPPNQNLRFQYFPTHITLQS